MQILGCVMSDPGKIEKNLFRMDVSRNIIMMPCCGWDKLCLSKIFLISKNDSSPWAKEHC